MSDQSPDRQAVGDGLGTAVAARVRPRLGTRAGIHRRIGRMLNASRSFSRSIGVPLSLRSSEGVPVGLPSIEFAAMAPPEYWLERELARPAAGDPDLARIREWRDGNRPRTAPPRRGLPMATRRRGRTAAGADTAPGMASGRFGGVATPTPAADIATGRRVPRPPSPSREQLWPTAERASAGRSAIDPSPLPRVNAARPSAPGTPAPTRDELWPDPTGGRSPDAVRPGGDGVVDSSASPVPDPMGIPGSGAAPASLPSAPRGTAGPGALVRRIRDRAATQAPVGEPAGGQVSLGGPVTVGVGGVIRAAKLPVTDLLRPPVGVPIVHDQSGSVSSTAGSRPRPAPAARSHRSPAPARPASSRRPAGNPSATGSRSVAAPEAGRSQSAHSTPVATAPSFLAPSVGTTAARPHPFGLRPNGSQVHITASATLPTVPPRDLSGPASSRAGTTGGPLIEHRALAAPTTSAPRPGLPVSPTPALVHPQAGAPVPPVTSFRPVSSLPAVRRHSPPGGGPVPDSGPRTVAPTPVGATSAPLPSPSALGTPGVLVRRAPMVRRRTPSVVRRAAPAPGVVGHVAPVRSHPSASAPPPPPPGGRPSGSSPRSSVPTAARRLGTDGLRVGGVPLPAMPATPPTPTAQATRTTSTPTAAELRARLDAASNPSTPLAVPPQGLGTGRVGVPPRPSSGATIGRSAGPAVIRRSVDPAASTGAGPEPADASPRPLTRADAGFLLREVERMVRREVERRGHHHRGGRL